MSSTPGDQGQGARHRLRSQAGGRGGGARVRAQCRPGRRSRPTAPAATSWPSSPPPTRCWASAASACRTPASSARTSADVGARLSGIDMNRDDKAHRFVVTWNAFLDGNRLAYLALIAGHRRRRAGVHVRPVRRPGAALAALRRAEPEGAQRPPAGGHHRGGAAARHLQECAAGAARHASDGAGRRLHQRGQARRARPRERLPGARRAERRRDHRRGARDATRTATTWCAPSCTRSCPTSIKRELKRKPEETRARARPRPAREAHPRGADAACAGDRRTPCCSTCIRSTRCAASRRRSSSTRSTSSTCARCATC